MRISKVRFKVTVSCERNIEYEIKDKLLSESELLAATKVEAVRMLSPFWKVKRIKVQKTISKAQS